MTTSNLAKMKKISPRQIWGDEAKDFTPWLYENIDELGSALGLSLVSKDYEVAVGKYSLDILAEDLGENRRVVIENQLGRSDHGHLGQLLTYAADSDDNALVVWVAPEFEIEHLKALDWLNKKADSSARFFGVSIEVWSIDDSLPAPLFRLAGAPEGWSTRRRSDPRPPPSERMARYREFFQMLIDVLREEHRFTSAQKARPDGLYVFSSGLREFKYWASSIDNQRVRIDLRIESGSRDLNLALLEKLRLEQEPIESEFGEALEWDEMEGNRGCRVAITVPGSIDDEEAVQQQLRVWMVKNLLKFKEVFSQRLGKLTPYIRQVQQEQTTLD